MSEPEHRSVRGARHTRQLHTRPGSLCTRVTIVQTGRGHAPMPARNRYNRHCNWVSLVPGRDTPSQGVVWCAVAAHRKPGAQLRSITRFRAVPERAAKQAGRAAWDVHRQAAAAPRTRRRRRTASAPATAAWRARACWARRRAAPASSREGRLRWCSSYSKCCKIRRRPTFVWGVKAFGGSVCDIAITSQTGHQTEVTEQGVVGEQVIRAVSLSHDQRCRWKKTRPQRVQVQREGSP